jgi:15-cis-phytoene synthase
MTREQSFEYCRGVARRRAKNFYYAFLLLDRPRRDAMCAIYAFMRYCDDLSDERGAERSRIERWRTELVEALEGRYSDHPVWPAFHDTVRRYNIPHTYFFDMIDGVTSDLEPRRIQTFDELYRYCYQVASVVGMTIIHIFGFDSPDAPKLAERCGIAFQLTNILRDIAEDGARGRVYLPAEDMGRFGIDAIEPSQPLRELLHFEAERAFMYYDESLPLIGMVHPRSRASLAALIQIYRRLLERIQQSNYDVLTRRISVPPWEKVWIVVRAYRGIDVRRLASLEPKRPKA